MDSVDTVVRRHRAALARVAGSYAPPGAEREDLLQDMRAALVAAWPRFRGDCSERSYVFRVAHNVALRHVHRRRRWRREAADPDHEALDRGPGPEIEAAARQRAERLLAAVRQLRDPYREVAVLALEGLEPREMAEAMGISANAAAVRLFRAKKLLAESLKELNDER